MARQLATSAALPVLNTFGDSGGSCGGLGGFVGSSGESADPHPRRHVMRMYTCPDHYVVFPPATGAGPGAAAVVVERASMRAWPAAPGEAERLASGRAKIEILGVTAPAPPASPGSLNSICRENSLPARLPASFSSQARSLACLMPEFKILGSVVPGTGILNRDTVDRCSSSLRGIDADPPCKYLLLIFTSSSPYPLQLFSYFCL